MVYRPAAPTAVVLIVEDDFLLRLDAAEFIADAGFAVLQASSADEAIELLTHHSEIQVVFTDIEMPGSMDGLKLAAAVRDRWPPVELIVTSGRPSGVMDHEMPERSRFVAKPYTPRQIVTALQQIAATL